MYVMLGMNVYLDLYLSSFVLATVDQQALLMVLLTRCCFNLSSSKK